MGVRIRLKTSDRELETSALVTQGLRRPRQI